MNYNFKCKKPNQLQSSKLMKGAEYEEFDQIINKLKNHRKSQRINVSSKHSKKEEFPSVNSLREQFKASHKQVK
jgi:cobalamin biosynthesis Co2+ chelatase CbiK